MTKRIELADNPSIRVDDLEIDARSSETVEFRAEGTLSLGKGVLGAVVGSTLTPSTIAFSTGASSGASSGDSTADAGPEASEEPTADSSVLEIDLEDGAALHLENVDVGVELTERDGVSVPTDADDVAEAMSDPLDPLASNADADSDSDPTAMADGVLETDTDTVADPNSTVDEDSDPDPDSDPDSDSRAGVIAFTLEGVLTGLPAESAAVLSSGDPRPKSITFAVDESLETDGGDPDNVTGFEFLVYRIAIRRDGTIVVGFRQDVNPTDSL